MNELPRTFGREDLPGSDEVDAAELAEALRTGRDLESFAAAERVDPSPGFLDRVMAAVEAEPAPQPAGAAARAIETGRPVAFLAAIRDAWRVAFSGGRPMLVRAQAMAVVLVAVLALGTLGGVATVGALALLDRGGQPSPSPSVPIPSPSVSPTPVPTPSPTPSPTPTPSPSPSPTVDPTDTDGPTETPDDETEEPTETPDDDDNSGPGSGSGSGSGSSGSGSSGSGDDDPTETPGSTDDRSGSDSGSDDEPQTTDDSSGRGSGD